MRAQEVVLSILRKGNELDSEQDAVYDAALRIRRVLRRRGGLRHKARRILDSWDVKSTRSTGNMPLYVLRTQLSRMGVAMTSHFNLVHDYYPTVHVLTDQCHIIEHALRMYLRIDQWQKQQQEKEAKK